MFGKRKRPTTPKVILPVNVGELLPWKGFTWRVTSADQTNITLQVCGVTKEGAKFGYTVHHEDPSPLNLSLKDKV